MMKIALEDPIHRLRKGELEYVPDYPEWAYHRRESENFGPDIYYLTCFDGRRMGINTYRDIDETWHIHLSYVDEYGFSFFEGRKLIYHRTYPEDDAAAREHVDWLLENLPSAVMMEALA